MAGTRSIQISDTSTKRKRVNDVAVKRLRFVLV